MKNEPHIQAFLDQTFSTTEAAVILGIPAETFRTQLKQDWLPVTDDREPGQWRRISPEDLLRTRLALTLSDQGVALPDSKKIIQRERPDFFEGGIFLWVAVNRDGSIKKSGLAKTNDLIQSWDQYLSFVGRNPERPNRIVVILLNAERAWISARIDQFYRDQEPHS